MATVDSFQADVLALDAHDQPVMLVETQAFAPIDETDQHRIMEALQQWGVAIPYVMLLDPQTVRIYAWTGHRLDGPRFEAQTADVLSFYDAEFTRKRIFDYYFRKLTEAWLHDLAYHWKSASPPYFQELMDLGVIEKLQNGTTVAEVNLAIQLFTSSNSASV